GEQLPWRGTGPRRAARECGRGGPTEARVVEGPERQQCGEDVEIAVVPGEPDACLERVEPHEGEASQPPRPEAQKGEEELRGDGAPRERPVRPEGKLVRIPTRSRRERRGLMVRDQR